MRLVALRMLTRRGTSCKHPVPRWLCREPYPICVGRERIELPISGIQSQPHTACVPSGLGASVPPVKRLSALSDRFLRVLRPIASGRNRQTPTGRAVRGLEPPDDLSRDPALVHSRCLEYRTSVLVTTGGRKSGSPERPRLVTLAACRVRGDNPVDLYRLL